MSSMPKVVKVTELDYDVVTWQDVRQYRAPLIA